jgi:hypothetical protein
MTDDASLQASSKRLLAWLVAVAFFMESLDTTILNTAVPAIAAALQVAPLSMKSVLASYTLSLAVFIPIGGWMADRFGTRRVFASAIGLFTLGSLLGDCGGPPHAPTWWNFQSAAHHATPLAYVLWAVHRNRLFLPRPATSFPGFPARNHFLDRASPAALSLADLLAHPRPLQEGLQGPASLHVGALVPGALENGP